jgi:hypothetical protein
MSKLFASTPETPSTPSAQAKKRISSKNRYFVAMAVLTAVIVVGALLIPPSAAAIPLNVDYAVGEKMVYGTTVTATIQIQNSSFLSDLLGEAGNQTAVINGESTIEVVSFDGQYYTLNQTVTTQLGDKPFHVLNYAEDEQNWLLTYMFDLGNVRRQFLTQPQPTKDILPSCLVNLR